jgi:hypothetical protein
MLRFPQYLTYLPKQQIEAKRVFVVYIVNAQCLGKGDQDRCAHVEVSDFVMHVILGAFSLTV